MRVEVQAAAMHKQSVADAPANVTVVTQEEIRRYGFQSLADVLSYVRGFDVTSDRTYYYAGLRGFNLPGDYATRFLLMVDGHSLVFNVDNSVNAFGQDFPLDLSLVKQIEIIRGPVSALYGSNGMMATINVVTKDAASLPAAEVRAETGSFGYAKTQLTSAVTVGREGRLVVSASIFRAGGEHSIYLPEYDTPETNFGRAINMNSERGAHVFANYSQGNWNGRVLFGISDKIQPVSWTETVFNDRGTGAGDARGFAEATYARSFSEVLSFEWRASYDAGRYAGAYRYFQDEQIADSREKYYGDWLSSRFTGRISTGSLGAITVGTDVAIELRTLQVAFDLQPAYNEYLRINTPDKLAGIFGQHEFELGRHWKTNVGVRFDYSERRAGFVSPRAALIYQPAASTSIKLLAGRAFRNPSAYETYFDDGGLTGIANPELRPEYGDTYEIILERQIGKRWKGLASIYNHRFRDAIAAQVVQDGPTQYQNAGAHGASGLEFELKGRAWKGVGLRTSLAIRKAVDSSTNLPLPNSPGSIAALQVGVPVLAGRFIVSGGTRYMSERRTRSGAELPAILLSDLTSTSRRFAGGLELQVGLRNLGNLSYVHPIGLLPTVDTIRMPGRTFFVALGWAHEER